MPTIARGSRAFDADLDRALGDVLGEIADPFEIARDPNGADDLAQVDRHRLPARDRQHRLLLDLALERVEPRIGLHHLMGEVAIAGGQRVHRVDHHFLGDAAHLGDPPLEQVEILVVGSDSMLIRHWQMPPSAEAASDVILRALVARRGEDRVRLIELDHLAQIHEGGVLRARAPPAACCG